MLILFVLFSPDWDEFSNRLTTHYLKCSYLFYNYLFKKTTSIRRYVYHLKCDKHSLRFYTL